MSSHAATATAAIPDDSTAPAAGTALVVGLIGTGLTAIGLFVSGASPVALSWLVGITFWTAIAIGMLMMCLIHHIFDASWSVVIRRQWEHGLSAFMWLGILFMPLILASLFYGNGDVVWPWMNPGHELHGGHRWSRPALSEEVRLSEHEFVHRDDSRLLRRLDLAVGAPSQGILLAGSRR
jgi:hypothetical protein